MARPGGDDPEALYTVSMTDVWRVEDYPKDVYDSNGTMLAQ